MQVQKSVLSNPRCASTHETVCPTCTKEKPAETELCYPAQQVIPHTDGFLTELCQGSTLSVQWNLLKWNVAAAKWPIMKWPAVKCHVPVLSPNQSHRFSNASAGGPILSMYPKQYNLKFGQSENNQDFYPEHFRKYFGHTLPYVYS